jgi:hypothetical protein
VGHEHEYHPERDASITAGGQRILVGPRFLAWRVHGPSSATNLPRRVSTCGSGSVELAQEFAVCSWPGPLHSTGQASNRPQAAPTQPVGMRLGMLRTLVERVIEWDDPDAPSGACVRRRHPQDNEPLPRFLDDPSGAKFMAAQAVEPDRRRRLVVELLAHTGMFSRGQRPGQAEIALERLDVGRLIAPPVHDRCRMTSRRATCSGSGALTRACS